ncbi:MAG: DUF2231 domain-containing protein [Armatimonadota bacterium]|nr:DUF2231 domain-containing protein [Armatimonadota bacterium]MDR7427175.1 DUF2231 domain-containing protein [Armatimonadota bacterium]MDR7465409.1 DUF2231 domain-containing protein [Armatimonadota bacterium]MDR7473542.1 DUF2231 domain-containing protein [Armatimonadota bacterium]MDR7539979.1 DUF2231 domain-containing protein [Armatimonadota bacterium]
MVFLYHPLVVHFPVALWLTSALFELLYLARRERLYAIVSRLLIGLGLLGAAASIASGFLDLDRQVALGVGSGILLQHRLHSLLAYGATAAYLLAFLGRWRRGVVPVWTTVLSLVGALATAAAGFSGGELRRVM